MKNKLLLIMNPSAGQRRANRVLPEILRVFLDEGYRCEVYITAARGDATRFAAGHAAEFDRIVCVGGDGTLNETISGLMQSGAKVPLGYIPAGSTNDFAATLGLSGDPITAARDAVRCAPRPIDIGSFNGRHFIYTASCGAFTRASYSAPQNVKNTLGHAAYVLEGIRDLRSLRPYPLRVELGGQVLEGDFIFMSVTNSTSVGGILKLDAAQVALNDGRFEVLLIKNPVNPTQLSNILRSLTLMEFPDEMITFTTAERVTVEADAGIDWTLDGEHQPGSAHIDMLNLHSAVRIAMPRLPHGLEEEME